MFYATRDATTALMNGYIGEIPIHPTPIANAVYYMFTGRYICDLLIFYYGERDKRLSNLFGYNWPAE